MNEKNKLIVAVDVPSFEEARVLVDELSPEVDIFKIGSQLFTACGPVVIRYILAQGKKVFLDLKFHDIPNTVANAVSSAVGIASNVYDVLDEKGKEKEANGGEILLCTLHTLGGKEMMQRAQEAAIKRSKELGVVKPNLVGITVLTSEKVEGNTVDLVLERAALAKDSGLDGVVASAQESAAIRKEFGKEFIIVTPGIRPAGSDVGDQKRITTPADAIASGSDYLVVGRPIVKAENKLEAARNILEEMSSI